MVQVDQDLCIACGLCFSTHPDFFVLDTDGKAKAIKQVSTDEEKATVQEAIDNCPVGAISNIVVEESTPVETPIIGEAPIVIEEPVAPVAE
ncbi:MAG: ferredoxin [candidate division SR1 bacterium]|nr:ferredoxin [candidate division SR1 bacterium]